MDLRGWSAAALLLLVPTAARAGNGSKLRTPVLWDDPPCMTVVDRSVESVLHLPYDVGREDPPAGEELPLGEVDDSRTHQFLAFSREHPDFFYLPNWLTEADVVAAAMKNIVELDTVTPAEVLETNQEWAGQWFRITGDEDRRPITFADAEQGVDWDTSELAPGTYTVHGYTHEPAFNLYERRPGVIKVVDGGPADAYGPAVAFEREELLVYRDSTVVLRGCVDTMNGSTLTAEWALLTAELEWTPFVEDVPVETGPFELELRPPEQIVGDLGLVRATVRDPTGREYTTHLVDALSVLDEDDPVPCGSSCAEGTATDTGTGDTSTSAAGDTTQDGAEGAPGAEGPGTVGCSCAHARAGTWRISAWGWLLLALRRRRMAGLVGR